MPFFKGQGFQLHYEIFPRLLPETTLFIHGNLSCNAWWEPALESLARARDSRSRDAGTALAALPGLAILAEWRGCGKSEGPRAQGDLEMERLARDLIELLGHLGVSNARIVGHSTGGLIGLHALRLAPDLFQRAVLLDPVPATGLRFGPESLEVFRRMGEERAVCEDVLAATILDVKRADPYFQRLVDAAFGVHPAIWEGVPRALEPSGRGSIPAAGLREISQPVLVLHGDRDPILPWEGSRSLAGSLPRGSYRGLAGQGHSCNVENPELFTRLVEEFLFGAGPPEFPVELPVELQAAAESEARPALGSLMTN